MKSLPLTAALFVLGLTTPLLMQATTPLVATARVIGPDGDFFDREWNISVYYQNNSYHYTGYNRRTGRSIELSGAVVSGDRQRKVYTWNNDGTWYQVIWQPQDPNYIRVRVIASGREVLNRLLPRAGEDM
jgi:hypothetical protein